MESTKIKFIASQDLDVLISTNVVLDGFNNI
jgi:hypothetical protein